MGIQTQYVEITDLIIDSMVNGPLYTVGASRSSPLTFAPTLMEKWTIIGFTTRAYVSINARDQVTVTNPVQFNGRCGALWGGIYKSQPLPHSNTDQGPTVPADLSAFTPLWDGEQPVKVNATNVVTAILDQANQTLLAQTYMLPVPIPVRQGTQLGVGIFLLPSLIEITAGGAAMFSIVIPKVTFAVLYDDGNQ